MGAALLLEGGSVGQARPGCHGIEYFLLDSSALIFAFYAWRFYWNTSICLILTMADRP